MAFGASGCRMVQDGPGRYKMIRNCGVWLLWVDQRLVAGCRKMTGFRGFFWVVFGGVWW